MSRRSLQKAREKKPGTRYGRKRKTSVVRERLPKGSAHVTPVGGNIFRDLGFSPVEAENLKIRTDLMTALQRLMTERRLTQVQAAKLFGVSQPRISDLKRDKIGRFTIDAGQHACVCASAYPFEHRALGGVSVVNMKSVIVGAALAVAVASVAGCGGDDPPVTPTEAASLSFTAQPTEALEKVPLAPVRVQALDAAGKPATARVDITIEVLSRGTAIPFAGTKSLTTRNGVASFTDLGIDTPGRGFTLVARAPGLPAVTSQPFDVFVRFKQVSSGGTTVCGLTYDNVTWCWGDNTLFRLGVGDDVPRSAPARLLGNFRFDTITVGGIQQCGRLTSNDVFCWGGRHPTPTPVAGYKFTWVVSGGGSCGIATNGSLQCWNGPEGAAVITPTERAAGPYKIGATYLYICAIALDGQTYCMGGNERGELGFTGPGAEKFTQPVSNVRLTNVSPSIHHACGLDAEGVAWCWGDNGYGQLGAGSTAAYSATPLRAGANLRFRSVSLGNLHTCGLATDGTGWCWGRGDEGELGNGTNGQSNVPVRVSGPVPFVNLDAGGFFACGIGTNGFTYCWGNNNNGEVGDGTTANKSTPQRVVAPPP